MAWPFLRPLSPCPVLFSEQAEEERRGDGLRTHSSVTGAPLHLCRTEPHHIARFPKCRRVGRCLCVCPGETEHDASQHVSMPLLWLSFGYKISMFVLTGTTAKHSSDGDLLCWSLTVKPRFCKDSKEFNTRLLLQMIVIYSSFRF